MAIDQIAQLGLSSLQVIYYLAKLFRVCPLTSLLAKKRCKNHFTKGNFGLIIEQLWHSLSLKRNFCIAITMLNCTRNSYGTHPSC
ncbi:hypothetical protein D5071_00635 [Pectobacterium carotovorum]|uniref:Uncharacterized protein n=1 Tax=Pectobacterium carotovorum TaxID=554 RepID=A0A419B1J6_PECCA|nr:hypothetical protein D5071_00635 [Pectobacterium carotovorum]